MQKTLTIKHRLPRTKLGKGAVFLALYTLLILLIFSMNSSRVHAQNLAVEQTLGTITLLDTDKETIKEEATWTDSFHQQIKSWITEISTKDRQFKAWQGARYETYAFGPGSRQWIVLIFQNHDEIGYLIVGQAADQPVFELIEYGQTDEAIFSQALDKQPTFISEDFFYNGLLWAKKGPDNTLVDMLSEDYYDHLSVEIKPYWLGETAARLYKQVQTQVHSKAEPIVYYGQLGEETILSAYDLEEMNDYYYQGAVLPEVKGLYKVAAIHYWQQPEQAEPILFVGLVDEGVRYLSHNYLQQLGSFAPLNHH